MRKKKRKKNLNVKEEKKEDIMEGKFML